MSIGSELLSKATVDPAAQQAAAQVSTAEVKRERLERQRHLERQLADNNTAMQRHKPGTYMYGQVVEDRRRLLEQLAALEEQTDQDIREKLAAGLDTPQAAQQREQAWRAANSPEAMAARRQEIRRGIEATSAERMKKEALEAEVWQARQAAADAAEAVVRARHAAEHQAA